MSIASSPREAEARRREHAPASGTGKSATISLEHHRDQQPDAAGLRADRAGGARTNTTAFCAGSPVMGKGNSSRTPCTTTRHAPRSLHQGELRRCRRISSSPSCSAHGVGLHRRSTAPRRTLRGGRRRHAVPRRSGRAESGDTDQLKVSAAGTEFERLGGTETIRANIRLIAATNKDPRRRDCRGRVPRRPLLPSECVLDLRRRCVSGSPTSCCWPTTLPREVLPREHGKAVKRIPRRRSTC